ncbi:extracellular solute-binding protein [Novisyntrophococcus fermenticellae]|uniref:extracellular solute-binding protein n=1 Tax=Novisyntrophococcus fermenticellae TaxID=2068655 RepID=UPI001E40AB1C|nr:extracellular solute-binding protein [Novisyntrophococcus fermenticellae]
MRKKRMMCFGLAVVMTVGSLAACGKSDDNEKQEDKTKSAESTGPADPFGKYADPIDIHFARSTEDVLEGYESAIGQSMDDNLWLDTFKEELGIKVVYDWVVKGDAYKQKVNVTIASGDLPDVMAVDATQMTQLAESGLIQDLSDVYESYAADFTKESMKQEGEEPFMAAQIDGGLYGIPVTFGSYDSGDLLWIRDDWLDKLNLEAPKTTDELMNVIDKFTKEDPDGNGKDDTYGLAAHGTPSIFEGGYGCLKGFFNSYGAYPSIWIEKDGKLEYGAVQDECKDALEVLQKLYVDKKINPEFGVMDDNKAGEPAVVGQSGMSYGPQWLGLVQPQENYNNDENAKWSAYPIPGTDGDMGTAEVNLATNQWLVVRKDFKHPEAVIKMANVFMEKCWGKTGDNAKYYAPEDAGSLWKFSPVMPNLPLKNFDAYDQIQEAMKNKTTDQLTGEAKTIYSKLDKYYSGSEDGKQFYGWERIYGPAPTSYASIKEMKDSGHIIMNKFVGAPTPTMTEKMSTLEKMRNETFNKIIIGEADINEFDKFVKEFNKLGGEDITKEVNEWYTSVQ